MDRHPFQVGPGSTEYVGNVLGTTLKRSPGRRECLDVLGGFWQLVVVAMAIVVDDSLMIMFFWCSDFSGFFWLLCSLLVLWLFSLLMFVTCWQLHVAWFLFHSYFSRGSPWHLDGIPVLRSWRALFAQVNVDGGMVQIPSLGWFPPNCLSGSQPPARHFWDVWRYCLQPSAQDHTTGRWRLHKATHCGTTQASSLVGCRVLASSQWADEGADGRQVKVHQITYHLHIYIYIYVFSQLYASMYIYI